MTDTVEQAAQTVKTDATAVETKAAAVGTTIVTDVSNWKTKIAAWFAGHPGAAVALGSGLVIGFVIGFLWTH